MAKGTVRAKYLAQEHNCQHNDPDKGSNPYCQIQNPINVSNLSNLSFTIANFGEINIYSGN